MKGDGLCLSSNSVTLPRKLSFLAYRELRLRLAADFRGPDVKATVGTAPRQMGAGETRILANLACE